MFCICFTYSIYFTKPKGIVAEGYLLLHKGYSPLSYKTTDSWMSSSFAQKVFQFSFINLLSLLPPHTQGTDQRLKIVDPNHADTEQLRLVRSCRSWAQARLSNLPSNTQETTNDFNNDFVIQGPLDFLFYRVALSFQWVPYHELANSLSKTLPFAKESFGPLSQQS